MTKWVRIPFIAGVLAMLLCVGAFAAAPEARLVVTGPEASSEVGDTFTVTVALEDNPGFSAVQFTLVYDKEVLDCTEARVGEKLRDTPLNGANPKNAEGASVLAVASEPVTGDGTLAQYTFRVKKAHTPLKFELTAVILGREDGTTIAYTVTGCAQESPAGTPDEGQAEQENPTFSDVAGHWGRKYILQAASLGLFEGYPDGSFHPDDAVNRAQFVTVLWRMAGSPAGAAETPFTDIQRQSREFQTAIAWAYSQGYVKGTSAATFSPTAPLTRQEAMTILYRYSGSRRGMEVMFTGIYEDTFHDHTAIAGWAKNAMYWGVYHELIRGTGGNTLSPTGSATRAQIAKIMVMYTEKIGKGLK